MRCLITNRGLFFIPHRLRLNSVVFLLLSFVPGSLWAQRLNCRSATAESAGLIEYVKEVASRNTPARDSLGLAGVDTAQIVLVTTDSVCTEVTRSIDAANRRSLSAAAYIVVKAGNRYVALWPETNGVSGGLVHYVDTAFVYKSAVIY